MAAVNRKKLAERMLSQDRSRAERRSFVWHLSRARSQPRIGGTIYRVCSSVGRETS